MMPHRARKFVVFSIIAALAVANAFAPRHVQAAAGQSVPNLVAADHHLYNSAADRGHHYDAATPPLCRDDGKTGSPAGAPNHNCCVASCSVIAFIFSSISVDRMTPVADYGVQLAGAMMPASQNTVDPPPR